MLECCLFRILMSDASLCNMNIGRLNVSVKSILVWNTGHAHVAINRPVPNLTSAFSFSLRSSGRRMGPLYPRFFTPAS